MGELQCANEGVGYVRFAYYAVQVGTHGSGVGCKALGGVCFV